MQTVMDGRKKQEIAGMKNQLYEEIVSYIIENQSRFYRLAYSYKGNYRYESEYRKEPSLFRIKKTEKRS
jgi:hypothetical protein